MKVWNVFHIDNYGCITLCGVYDNESFAHLERDKLTIFDGEFEVEENDYETMESVMIQLGIELNAPSIVNWNQTKLADPYD